MQLQHWRHPKIHRHLAVPKRVKHIEAHLFCLVRVSKAHHTTLHTHTHLPQKLHPRNRSLLKGNFMCCLNRKLGTQHIHHHRKRITRNSPTHTDIHQTLHHTHPTHTHTFSHHPSDKALKCVKREITCFS